jgi:hypothetical protein
MPIDSPKRVFPPLYKTQGNEAADRLAFFHLLERLKVIDDSSPPDGHWLHITILSQIDHIIFAYRLKNEQDGSIIKKVYSLLLRLILVTELE